MRRYLIGLILAGLLTVAPNAPGGSAPEARPPEKTLPDVHWTLHVLYLPGTRDARPPLEAEGGTIAVTPPWRCVYKQMVSDQQEIVKIKCVHESGAVVGTLAMCRREVGQSDLAQISIGLDGVTTYETLDLSCSVPPRPARGDLASDERK